jgi:hypothetical protein
VAFCCKSVRNRLGIGTHPCSKRPYITRNGKSYCRVHDPAFVKEKNDAKEAAYQAALASRRQDPKDKRISELEAQLAALSWTPITPDNLPKVGEEVGGYDPAEAISVWRVRIVTKITVNADWRALKYTHRRPLNLPIAAPAQSMEKPS